MMHLGETKASNPTTLPVFVERLSLFVWRRQISVLPTSGTFSRCLLSHSDRVSKEKYTTAAMRYTIATHHTTTSSGHIFFIFSGIARRLQGLVLGPTKVSRVAAAATAVRQRHLSFRYRRPLMNLSGLSSVLWLSSAVSPSGGEASGIQQNFAKRDASGTLQSLV